MAKLKMRHYPEDLVLRRKAMKVSVVDDSIRRLIDDMVETMQQSSGVGLAAPQVGVSLRVIVLQMPDEQPIAIINPEIVESSGVQTVTEGCLSVPGYCGELNRPAHVVVKGKDRRGKMFKIKADGLMAEALEHEIDHLNGRLYIDHIDGEDRLYRVKMQEEND
ncbi:MAG: peptide deformylase [Dehalococcoidia bacterium]|nr:MAG: peptide deformylase [Dehalococcoidia bacterium]